MSDNTNRNAARAAAQGKKITLTFKGKSYTVAPPEEWDIDTLEKFEDGKVIGATRAVLGERQWAAFKSTSNKIGDVGELMDAIAKATGVQGN